MSKPVLGYWHIRGVNFFLRIHYADVE